MRRLKFEAFQRTAARSLLCVGWHYVNLMVVPLKERHRYYVQMMPSWHDWETHRMLCVPTLLRFSCFLGMFETSSQLLSWLLRETGIKSLR